MIKLDIDSPDFSFFSCNGDTLNIPALDSEKQPVVFIHDKMVNDSAGPGLAIREINSFLEKNNLVDDVILAPYPVEYDFSRCLKFENVFYKEYDNILYPERLLLRTIDHYVSKVSDDETVKACCEPFPLKRCKDVDDKLNLFVQDIKKSNLSPLERVLATYIICTHFIDSTKNDNSEGEYDDNIYSSVFHILSDDEDGYQIKCAGYTDLFTRMLAKLDIDAVPTLISCSNIDFYHSVASVDIRDQKYDINGKYICDVRFDSDNREGVDDKVRKIFNNERKEPYYTYDSLNYFCLTFKDYDFLVNPKMEQMIYSTTSGKPDAELELSDDRVGLGSINNALMRVSLFTYLSDNNNEMSTSDSALEKVIKDCNRTIKLIGKYRQKADTFYQNLEGIEK